MGEITNTLLTANGDGLFRIVVLINKLNEKTYINNNNSEKIKILLTK